MGWEGGRKGGREAEREGGREGGKAGRQGGRQVGRGTYVRIWCMQAYGVWNWWPEGVRSMDAGHGAEAMVSQRATSLTNIRTKSKRRLTTARWRAVSPGVSGRGGGTSEAGASVLGPDERRVGVRHAQVADHGVRVAKHGHMQHRGPHVVAELRAGVHVHRIEVGGDGTPLFFEIL
jgi:hypothetical protein